MIAKVFLHTKDVFTVSLTGRSLIFRLVPLVEELSYCSLTCQEFFVQGACPFPKKLSIVVFQRGTSVSFFMSTEMFSSLSSSFLFLIQTCRSFYESC